MELKNFFAQDDQGNKLPGALCYLYQRGTESLVGLLLSANGISLSNPFSANELGLIQLAVPNGLYDLRVKHGARDYRLPLQFNDVQETLESAESAAVRAEVARDAAQLFSGVKVDIAAGLISTPSGSFFSVPVADAKNYLILYLNSSGVAIEKGRYPSGMMVEEVLSSVNQSVGGDPLSVSDEAGWLKFKVDEDGGYGSSQAYISPDSISNQLLEIVSIPGPDVQYVDEFGFIGSEQTGAGYRSNALISDGFSLKRANGGSTEFVDEFGFVGMRLDSAGKFETSEPKNTSESAHSIAERNAINLAYSAGLRAEFNSEVQRCVAKYNHILMYGQSLSTGFEGWPALSKVARDGNLMYGNSTRPSSSAAAAFSPLGGAVLSPLKAVTQATNGTSILTDAQVAALTPGAGNEGESCEVGAVNFARKQFLQHYGLAADNSRLFVTSNCGVAGRTIEALSKGAAPELYQRLLQAAQGVKALAEAESASYCVPAIFWMQGEWNYNGTDGGDTTKAGYKAKLKAQAEIWKNEIAYGVAGQASPPAIITYQTGAGYTVDANGLSIGMAQWELSEEERNWFLATPIYPYTDKGGHLDSNGYRWVAMQLGKVLHRVVTLGQNWKPLSPRRVTVNDRTVLIDFHVPSPPLVFDTPYVLLAASDYANKGFRVMDAAGEVPISAVTIVADTVVKLTLGRAVGSNPLVQYATKTNFNGNGNLRDSDKTVACDKYLYQEDSGQYAGVNIPSLIDKPYPLHNWCIAFSLTPEII